ncbi:MAG TPA: N-acetyltransferase [Bacteroidetes bacterium]|nr:N-acetyltransferase [Bacteroidota bacterium]HRK05279.1 GNAT family N-acetyltransferase [Chlorobiota bacterium]
MIILPHTPLRGNIVHAKPLQPDDVTALFEVASDQLIWEQHPEPTRYQREVFERFFEEAIRSAGAYMVYETASGKVIGSSRFYDEQADRSFVKIGYTFLAREFWGGRYNADVKYIMISHALTEFSEVRFEIGERNVRSQRAIERIGARYIETVSKHFPGELAQPHRIYSISANEWPTIQQPI